MTHTPSPAAFIRYTTRMNSISAFDTNVVSYFAGSRLASLVETARLISYLGETVIVIAATAVITALLWYVFRHRTLALGLFVTVIGSGVSAYVLKLIVNRPRPFGILPAVVETSPSFPSGHATLSVALYGMGAYLLAKRYPSIAPLLYIAAAVFIVLIGLSRLYLGVHFPTDVLAGYLLGAFWIWIGIRVMELFPIGKKR